MTTTCQAESERSEDSPAWRKRSLLADDEAKEMKEEFCDVVKSLLIPLDSMLLNEDDKDVDSWIRSNRSSFFTIR